MTVRPDSFAASILSWMWSTTPVTSGTARPATSAAEQHGVDEPRDQAPAEPGGPGRGLRLGGREERVGDRRLPRHDRLGRLRVGLRELVHLLRPGRGPSSGPRRHRRTGHGGLRLRGIAAVRERAARHPAA